MISVVIPLFNKQKYVDFCIESLYLSAKNAGVEIEVVIVDDFSTDDSVGQVLSSERNVKLLQLNENKGPSYARNFGVKHAKFNFVYFIDADDFVDLNFFSALHLSLQLHPKEFVYVFGVQRVVDKIDYDHTSKTINSSIKCKTVYEYHRTLCEGLLLFTASSVCVRKDVFDEVGFFDEGSRYSEDAEFWARLSANYNSIVCTSKLCYYRAVNNSLSQVSFKKLEQKPILLIRLFKQINKSSPKEVRRAFSLMFLKYLFLVSKNKKSNKRLIWNLNYFNNCSFPYNLYSFLIYMCPPFVLASIFSLFLKFKNWRFN
ncbi:glycosyltransferase family A protein [Pseudoalteromonas sp. APC 3213]|uniref:glycosyltransferase family 2 protein n=1 Tax=Pseudoalteromonas sp. APC 3213 TaxID=3035178 RepID=UPI0025B51900|nr:glycosyltransferase family A protein [Pseudoalteromonas sp. APC 3213]MDN3401234.1 glycosyltransferase family A protein [Pseudoalteromonas sp. APC 3213]